eukprot:TRINITY_DN6652_c2_g1_i1.p1 TRINITY_DN6652_c2_g1~~TRINITY_DN6652_c2_g1_i1.p1  ORF type:complete len:129 (+),score=11.66 TRINITY_DN6652_c2_g1_i1:225-611(+)
MSGNDLERLIANRFGQVDTPEDYRKATNSAQFAAAQREALAIASDRSRIDTLLGRARGLLPQLGLIDEATDVMMMLEAHAFGYGFRMSQTAFLSYLGAIVYLTTPLDLIPDALPIWLLRRCVGAGLCH